MERHRVEENSDDQQEFVELYTKYYDTIYRYVHRRIPDVGLAEDVTQETFCTALAKMDDVRVHPKKIGWLMQTAKNKISEMYAGRPDPENETDIDYVEIGTTEDGYERSEIRIVLETALSEEDRLRIIRYYLRGMKIPEMAELENTTTGNVSVRIHRSMKKLADVLKDKKSKKSVRNPEKQPHIIQKDVSNASAVQETRGRKQV